MGIPAAMDQGFALFPKSASWDGPEGAYKSKSTGRSSSKKLVQRRFHKGFTRLNSLVNRPNE